MDMRDIINKLVVVEDSQQLHENDGSKEGDNGKAKGRERASKIRSETKVLLDSPVATVVIPQSFESAAYWGRGTRWGISEHFFDIYFRNGDFVIAKFKNGDQRFLYHPVADVAIDMNDRNVDIDAALSSYPDVLAAMKSVSPAQKQAKGEQNPSQKSDWDPFFFK